MHPTAAAIGNRWLKCSVAIAEKHANRVGTKNTPIRRYDIRFAIDVHIGDCYTSDFATTRLKHNHRLK